MPYLPVFAAVLLLAACANPDPSLDTPPPTRLRTEYLEEPLGIGQRELGPGAQSHRRFGPVAGNQVHHRSRRGFALRRSLPRTRDALSSSVVASSLALPGFTSISALAAPVWQSRR